MSISKDKERVFSPTGSIIITIVMSTVLAKDIFSKVKIPDTFSGDRKKFKTYETECRIYF
jgi:hypothetical protein